MPSQKNQQLLDSLKAEMEASKSVVVANYSGLNVEAQNDLRAKLTQVGGNLLVAKNRIFKLAARDSVSEGIDTLEAALEGQNAFLFSKEDAVGAIKILFEFAQNNEALEIKLGILDDRVLSYEETEALSKLPSKPELIAQLISRIQGPSYGLVNVLNGPTRGLVNVLNAIKDQKAETA